MKNLSLIGAATATLLLATGGLAQAQSSSDYFDWSGAYVGVHGGFGSGNFSGYSQNSSGLCVADGGITDTCVNLADLNLSGIAGGFQGGYNWQYGDMGDYGYVFGIEGDVTFTGWSDSIIQASSEEGVTGRIDLLASVRARAGITMNDVMVFATGGIAFASGSLHAFEQNGSTFESGTQQINSVGGVVGVGGAWAVNEYVSVNAEGLFYLFNDYYDTSGLDSAPGSTFGSSAASDFVRFDNAFVARIGVNFMID